MCAAAFVQNRKSYTGCTDAPNPAGESGRPWCYVEAQVCVCVFLDCLSAWILFLVELLSADAAEAAWNYCAPIIDYDGVRQEVSNIFADKAAEVQSLVAKLQKTQRAAEQALDKFVLSVHMVAVCGQPHAHSLSRYEKTCAE